MKKFLCFIMTAIFLLSTVSVGVCAATIHTGYYESDFEDAISFDPTTAIDLPNNNGENALRFFSEDPDAPYTYYSFLNAEQKNFYNIILEDPFQTQFSIPLLTDIEVDCAVNSSNQLVIPAEIGSEISSIIVGGISALGDDYPQYFWIINGYSYSYSYSYYQSDNPDKPYHVIISSLNVTITVDTVYGNMENLTSLYNQMMSVRDSIKVNGNSRYEKVKSIHDSIANLVVYDPNLNKTGENPTDHEPVSVFLEPHITVCEGYAEAFKMLCDREGIPCLYIVGTAGGGHAWNYVKMEDGKWYAVDCTWDDQDGYGLLYDYFLVGSASTSSHFNSSSSAFSSVHIATGNHFPSSTYVNTYPTLATDAYFIGMLNNNSTASVDKAKSLLYIFSGTTASSMLMYPSGYTSSYTQNGNRTGATYTVKNTSTSASITYTIIVRGDVVIDGNANFVDYAKIKDYAIGRDAPPSENQREAADLNHDGTIDGFDIYAMNKMINGYSIY